MECSDDKAGWDMTFRLPYFTGFSLFPSAFCSLLPTTTLKLGDGRIRQ